MSGVPKTIDDIGYRPMLVAIALAVIAGRCVLLVMGLCRGRKDRW